jgi:hypothetical protein
MDLVATPKNPIPLGVSVGFLKGKGGVPLRFARWRSALHLSRALRVHRKIFRGGG